MKRIWVLLVLAAPLIAMADSPDASFYKKAAEGGIAEIEAGNLAQTKADSQKVKDFGAMMVKDHSAANDKLKAVAMTKDITLPTSSSVGQMATKAKLEVLTGDTFDKSYVKGMIEDHKADIKEFQKEASQGKDPDAKAFAAATLPTLQAHLTKIQSIAAAAGIKD